MANTHIIKEIAEKENLAVSALETAIGVANGTLSKAIEKKGEISAYIEKRLLAKYPTYTKVIQTGSWKDFSKIPPPPSDRQTLNISQFLPLYREAVKEATGTALSQETLAQKLGGGITKDNITKWEQNGNVPACATTTSR